MLKNISKHLNPDCFLLYVFTLFCYFLNFIYYTTQCYTHTILYYLCYTILSPLIHTILSPVNTHHEYYIHGNEKWCALSPAHTHSEGLSSTATSSDWLNETIRRSFSITHTHTHTTTSLFSMSAVYIKWFSTSHTHTHTPHYKCKHAYPSITHSLSLSHCFSMTLYLCSPCEGSGSDT